MKRILFLIAGLTSGIAWAADLPDLPAGTWECHGQVQLRGQTKAEPFWLRLLPADAHYGGNRLIQVVYTPPPVAVLNGTRLADAPFLLVDAHSRLVAWNDRAGSSQVTPGAAGVATYVATRDRTLNDQSSVVTDERRITGERGWERSLAPLLLALTWRAGTRAQLPCVDLYGDEPTSAVAWNGTQVAIAGEQFTIQVDATGRLHELVTAGGISSLTLTSWLKEGR